MSSQLCWEYVENIQCRGEDPHKTSLSMTLKYFRCWGPSSRDLGGVKYVFLSLYFQIKSDPKYYLWRLHKSLTSTLSIHSQTVQLFQVSLCNTSNLIIHCSFFCTQLNDFKHCYLILIIQFNINHSFVRC